MKLKKLNHEQMNSQNWRYKKHQVPTDEYAHLNGPVRVTKPPISREFKRSRYANKETQAAAAEYAYQMKLGKKLKDII